jgi:hypothetical protein
MRCVRSGWSWTGSGPTSFTSARPIRGALPLVLPHGWPGSVIEFLKVIGPSPTRWSPAGRRTTPSIHLTPPLAPPDPATFDDLTERGCSTA